MNKANRYVTIGGAVALLLVLTMMLTSCVTPIWCTSTLEPGCDPMTKWHGPYLLQPKE